MESNQDEIRKHYDDIKQVGVGRRELLETINVRRMNNFIKSVMINEHVGECAAVVDLGCGRGGDLKKFGARGISEYWGVDISANSIEDAKVRYRKSMLRFRASYVVADVYHAPLALGKRFDVASIQFSLHYAFSDIGGLRTTLSNIRAHLKSRGKLIASVPNSETLLRRYARYGNFYGNSLYSVAFAKPYEEIMAQSCRLGVEYRFTLKDSVEDCVEYLVDIGTLERECSSIGLRIVEHVDFMTYFNRHAKKYLALHDKMLPERLSDEELKICELYAVMVIERTD